MKKGRSQSDGARRRADKAIGFSLKSAKRTTMVGHPKNERIRRKRYLDFASDAETAARQAHNAVARATLLKAAESWRFLAELSGRSPGEHLRKVSSRDE